MPLPRLSLALTLLSTPLLATLLTGCGVDTIAPPSHIAVPGTAISGVAFGGQQPITGSKVYLLAANPAGYGSASLSLLTSASTGSTVDSIGAYTTTAPVTGGFSLAGDYDCGTGYALGASTSSAGTSLPGDEQVYLLVRGGNPGSGTNNSIGLIAALGACNALYSTKITVNELTTIAAAYAFAGFATDATHLASSGSSLARLGLSKASLNAYDLVPSSTGIPSLSSGSITRPTATIYTLGNILAACVNGTSVNGKCSTLFGYTESDGTVGTTPSETATAAINLAHNPWPTTAGMTALYGLVPATGAPFSGGLSSQPNDFTVGFNYKGGGLNQPQAIAIDASGYAWVANYGNNSVSKFGSTGVAVSATGYTGGGLNKPNSIAIDASGFVWTTNQGNNTFTKLSSTGTASSPSSGYIGSGMNAPIAIAIDPLGNAWAANNNAKSVTKISNDGAYSSACTGGGVSQSLAIAFDTSNNAWITNTNPSSVSKLANDCTAISPSTGYTGGGIDGSFGIAIDASGDAWTSNLQGNSLAKLASNGSPVSPSSGYTNGGLNQPYSVAIDGAGNVWVSNFNGPSSNNYAGISISKFSNTGTAISPTTGYTSVGYSTPYSLAIDGSGNVWVANNTDNSVTELIGAAVPVVTPVVANLTAPYTTAASRP